MQRNLATAPNQTIRWAVAFCLLAVCATRQASAQQTDNGRQAGDTIRVAPGLPDDHYAFQRLGGGRPMQVGLSYELGYGTKETRFFGGSGLEQGVRARWNPASFLTVEGFGEMLIAPGRKGCPGGSVMLLGKALNQERFGVDLYLGGGYVYDFRKDHVLRFMAGLGRRFGKIRSAISAVVEAPLTGERDDADFMFAASVMVPVTQWYAQGIELGGEDLEGLWNHSEAEGGARFLFGPTAVFYPWKGLMVRLNTSLVYAYVDNQVVARTPPFGIAAKISFGYRF